MGLPMGAVTHVSSLQKNYENFCQSKKISPSINWQRLLDPTNKDIELPKQFKDYFSAVSQRGLEMFKGWVNFSSNALNLDISSNSIAERHFLKTLKNEGWTVHINVEQVSPESAIAEYRSQVAFRNSGTNLAQGNIVEAARKLIRTAELTVLRDSLRDATLSEQLAKAIQPGVAEIIVRGSDHQQALIQGLSSQDVNLQSTRFEAMDTKSIEITPLLRQGVSLTNNEEPIAYVYRLYVLPDESAFDHVPGASDSSHDR
jgi:hypothetical protein